MAAIPLVFGVCVKHIDTGKYGIISKVVNEKDENITVTVQDFSEKVWPINKVTALPGHDLMCYRLQGRLAMPKRFGFSSSESSGGKRQTRRSHKLRRKYRKTRRNRK